MELISFLENPLNLTIPIISMEQISILEVKIAYLNHFHFWGRNGMNLHFGKSFKLNLVRMEWISFLENPSNSLRALMSQCQTTHIVSYYHPLFITLSCTLNPIDFICHLSFIFSLIVGPHRLSAIITLVSLQSQLISLLYYYFLSQYQPLQIVSYYHSTLYHFVNPNR